MDEFKRQAGILGDTVQNNERLAHSIVNASFHHAKFSDRVWMSQDLMKYRLNEILTQALIQGLNPKAISNRVMPLIKKEILENKRAAAERLLRTELCRVQTDAQMKSFERNGYDRYIFLAEPTACPHCRALDDKVFTLKEMAIGENAPPVHPHCRCSTAAYYDETSLEQLGVRQSGEKYKFEPAESLQEAEEYAKKFFDSDFMDRTFKGVANYKGISLEHANEINKTLEKIYGDMDLPKISGIKSISGMSKQGKKVFYDSEAIAAYDPIQKGIYLNRDILKNRDTFESHTQKSKAAWDYVMENIGSLSGAAKEKALIYKKAGRSLVCGDTLEGVITHEMGHHVQWTVLDIETNNYLGERKSVYAHKISGYANTNKSEYFAESFAAFRKGEAKLVDPVYLNVVSKQLKHYNNDIAGEISNISDKELLQLNNRALLREKIKSGKI